MFGSHKLGLAWRSLRRKFGRDSVVCSVRGLQIRLGVVSEIEHYRAKSYSEKEPETLDWLDESLRDGDVFFDIGANIGVYSLYAALRRPACSVYSFEPAAPNFARLCRNLAMNRVSNVIACSFPISDRSTFSLLHLSTLEEGSALHALQGEHDFPPVSGPALQQGVLVTTLDELITVHKLPPPNLLKLDVDGIEGRVIAGAKGLLRSHCLRSVLVECARIETAASSPMEDALHGAGFNAERESAWSVRKQGKVVCNRLYNRLGSQRGLRLQPKSFEL